MNLSTNKILSIAEARKLLGNEGLDMTDEEIFQMIEDFDVISQYFIKEVQKFGIKNNIKSKK